MSSSKTVPGVGYHMPREGMSRHEVETLLDGILQNDPDERHAIMSIYSMSGSAAVQELLLSAFGRVFHKNNLVAKMMPGMQEIEEQLLAMAANVLSGGRAGVVTNMTSGGTESIFCAIHAAREWARISKPHIVEPEFVAPYTAHASLNKAGHFLGVKVKRVPVRDFRTDIAAVQAAISPNTIGLYGSAPNWPYGTYDPIVEFGRLALENDIWLHVDACVGGFMAPFAKQLGYPVPEWDFSVPGVMSISADLHKYAYAMKSASVVAWREASLQKYHYVTVTDWPTRAYSAQGFVGSRSAGPVAAAWSVMHFLGEQGYLEYTRKTMENKARLAKGIEALPGLSVLDNELCILCYRSQDEALPIVSVLGGMMEQGWIHFGTTEPPMIQLILDPSPAPYIDDYQEDLGRVVARVRSGERFAGKLRYTA